MDYNEIKDLFEKIESMASDIKQATQRADRITIDDVVGLVEDVHKWADEILDLAYEKQDVLNLVDGLAEERDNLREERDAALEHIQNLGAYGDACTECPAELNCMLNK